MGGGVGGCLHTLRHFSVTHCHRFHVRHFHVRRFHVRRVNCRPPLQVSAAREAIGDADFFLVARTDARGANAKYGLEVSCFCSV